jgi:hypothetical protein
MSGMYRPPSKRLFANNKQLQAKTLHNLTTT